MGAANKGSLERFQDLVRSLFQCDTADLDFGLYRLLNLKRAEVEAFITEDLPHRVEEAFSAANSAEIETLERRLNELRDQIRQAFGGDQLDAQGQLSAHFQETPLGREYEEARRELEEAQRAASNAQGYQEQVFNHLYAFFSRYYEDGDFIPRRRYGATETYAVPYNGEEVFFHWATRDMHYVKTGERFRDYAFNVESLGESYRVRFVLTEATVAKDNTKGDTRYFFPLADRVNYDEDTRTLTVPFEYRLPTPEEAEKYGRNDSARQEAILDEAVPALLGRVSDDALAQRLAQPAKDDEPEGPCLLAKHLRYFTRRQTSDFFIHRDLRGFLRRELDFYLKDQVLQIEDLAGDFAAKRRVIEVIRRVGRDIIEFLAQIEDAQKRLFEKRKFVLRTDYLCPIMHLPREVWPEVLANGAQQAAWAELFGLEEAADIAFAEAHPTLVVDTRHFDEDFKLRLLGAIADKFGSIAEATDGLCIHGENYQALRLLQPCYHERVQCIYIDPPYNTPATEIVYKGGYKHSTWLTLMDGRLRASQALLLEDSVVIIAIDDTEMCHLSELLSVLFPLSELLTVVVNHHPAGAGLEGANISATHEYALFLVPQQRKVLLGPAGGAETGLLGFMRTGTALSNMRRGRPNSFYAVLVHPATSTVVGAEPPPSGDDYPLDPTPEGYLRIYPIGRDGRERVWRRSYETCLREIEAGRIVCKNNERLFLVRGADGAHRPIFSNWTDTRYNAGAHGTNLLKHLMGYPAFSYPKSIHTVADCVASATRARPEAFVVDFFAGSGTTAHAVINLNREDGGRRKFILVEVADYFDTVMLPRIAKVMYCPDWKDGRPQGYPAKPLGEDGWPEWVERTPRLVKIVRLESYEDALHNLVTEETLARANSREECTKAVVGEKTYRLQYLLRLPLEANASILLSEKLEHPFNYTLEILTDTGPETRAVDVIETFNFLYGLDVERVERWKEAGREYRAVRGRNRDGRRVLVLWRDMDGLTDGEASRDAIKAEREFLERKLAELKETGWEPDEALINGDCAVPGIRSLDGEFRRRMEEPEA